MNYTKEETNLIILSSFTRLTYSQKRLLLNDLTCATPDFAKCRQNLIKSLSDGVYNKIKADYFDGAYGERVLKELDKRGIVCVTYFSKNYPECLKLIPAPPIVLYCKGNLNLLISRKFAVVGSRKTLPNVLKDCKKVAGELTQHFTVVTGMADGADACAIEGALESGKVISVLANGFDYVYPAMNANLVKKVESSGLLITEYAPEVAPVSYNFPIRNRIIAGLSEGVLIVSAGRKSGALITAEFAEEYGKEVFAFPYGIGIASGAGCNYIIKNYATLAENTLDIFKSFGLDFKPQEKVALSAEELRVVKLLKECGELTVTQIAEKLGTLPFRLIPTLSLLEIKREVIRLGGNRYTALN